MLKILMDMLSPRTRAKNHGGKILLRFEEGEEKKHTDKFADMVEVNFKTESQLSMPQSAEGQKEEGHKQLQAQNKTSADMKVHVEDVEGVVFAKLVKELNIESFTSLADVTPVMEQYQKLSGCQVAIRQSEVDKFRVYKCAEHVNCVFKVHVVRRRTDDGKYVIKKHSVLRHTEVRRPLKASDAGRQ